MMVQVIRDEYVTNIPVRVLGEPGVERVQITGALRTSDSLIASASVPLLAGTLVRLGENGTPAGSAESGTTNPAGGRDRTQNPGATPPARGGRPAGRNAAGASPF